MTGRPKLSEARKKKRAVKELIAYGFGANEISRMMGVSQQAIYRYLKRHNLKCSPRSKEISPSVENIKVDNLFEMFHHSGAGNDADAEDGKEMS